MTAELFYTMLEISLSVSAAVVLMFLLMPFLKKRFTAKWRYWIWLVLAVRLLIPLNYHMPQPAVQIQAPQKAVVLQAPASAPAKSASLPARQARETPDAPQIAWPESAAAVWIAGIALFLAYRFSAYFFFLGEIRRWSTPVTDRETLAILQAEKSKLGVRQRVAFRRGKKIASPMMTGFFRPILLLPESGYEPGDLRLILKHELIHLKHRDVWFKLLLSFANAVHWFNPLIWLMAHKAGEDTELVCDGDVVVGEDESYRKRYGEVILAAVRQSRSCRTAYTTYFYGGVKTMKQRLFNIMDSRKKHRGIVAFCVVVLAAAAVGGSVAFGVAGVGRPNPAGEAAGNSAGKAVSSEAVSSYAGATASDRKNESSSAGSSPSPYSDVNVLSQTKRPDFGTIFCGSLKSDPQQGAAVVIWNGQTAGQKFLTPQKHGAIRAVNGNNAKDDVIGVVADDGYQWIFNMYNGFAQGHSASSGTVSASPSSQSSARTNGNNWVVYSNGKESQINGDWVIYDSNQDGYKLHKAKKDGSEDTVLVNDHVQTPCMAGEWIYYFKNLSEIDRIKSDGTQDQKACTTDGFQELDGSTATSAVYRDGYILYKLDQLVPAGDSGSAKTTYYKLDLASNKITQTKNAG